MHADRFLRLARAAMFAALSVALAAAAHVLMSGAGLPPAVLCAGLVAAGVLTWVFAGKERSGAQVVGWTVGFQAGLHVLFSLGQAVAATPGDRADIRIQAWAHALICQPGSLPLSDRAAARIVAASGLRTPTTLPPGWSGTGSMPGMASMGGMSAGHGGAAMLLGHLVAALVCGLWLAQGERAVFRALRSLAALGARGLERALCALAVAVAPSPDRAGLRTPGFPADRAARRPRHLAAVQALRFRGPPALATAAAR